MAIIKHANPCGIAVGADVAEAHRKAHACDPVSAFGGVIAVNRPGDASSWPSRSPRSSPRWSSRRPSTTARSRCCAAKKNLRMLRGAGARRRRRPSSGRSAAACWCRSRDRIDAPGDDPAELDAGRRRRRVDRATLADLAFAWRAVRAVKSNAILLAADGATVGVGMGQVNRVDSARLAVARAGRPGRAASVAASDAFFPFADGLQVLIDGGRHARSSSRAARSATTEVIAAAEAGRHHDVPHRDPALLPLISRRARAAGTGLPGAAISSVVRVEVAAARASSSWPDLRHADDRRAHAGRLRTQASATRAGGRPRASAIVAVPRRRRRGRVVGQRPSVLLGGRSGACVATPSLAARPAGRGERAVRQHTDALVDAERDHLPLLLAVDQVVAALHRDERGSAAARVCWALANCHAHISDAPRYRTLPPARRRAAPPSVSSIGRLVVPAMDLVEVDVVGAEPAQRGVDARPGCACGTGRDRSGPDRSGSRPWWRARSPRARRRAWRSSRPVISSLTPSEYMSAVSKKVTPASTARRTIGSGRFLAQLPGTLRGRSPKLIMPSATADTRRPDEPSRTYRMRRP